MMTFCLEKVGVKMKKLILLNGTMGVGKTATCNQLLDILQPSVFLDGDWCWNMRPFTVNDETRQMVLKNICFSLNNFLNCSEFKYVLFCWVMHEEEIMNTILDHLDLERSEVHKFTLSITETALKERLMKDISKNRRSLDILERSIARMGSYEHMNTMKIDVSTITPTQAAKKIVDHVN